MRKKIFWVVLFIIIFVIAASGGYFYKIYNNIYVGKTIEVVAVNSPTPTPTPDPLAPKNILLLGYGGVGHEGGVLTDTVILAHVVPRENRVTLISIPRDVWVPIQMQDGIEYYKINHAFAIGVDENLYPNKPPEYKGVLGGGQLAANAAGFITGLNIDYFVSINFNGFKNIIDILGGVDVYVPYSFKDEYYPIKGMEEELCEKSEEELGAIHATMSGELLEKEFKCRFETLEFTKGINTLDSEAALKFVRSRHSEIYGGDFGRSLRQQSLIVAIKNKLLNFGSITKIIPVINTISVNVQTDIDIKAATDLIRQQEDLDYIEITGFSLTTDNVFEETISDNGQYVLIPKDGEDNWGVVRKFVKEKLISE